MALAIYALVRGEQYERLLFMSLATRKGEGVNSYALTISSSGNECIG